FQAGGDLRQHLRSHTTPHDSAGLLSPRSELFPRVVLVVAHHSPFRLFRARLSPAPLPGRPRGLRPPAAASPEAPGLTSSARTRAPTVPQVGWLRPRSRHLTAAAVTPAAPASCCCVQPRAARSSPRRPANHSVLIIAAPSDFRPPGCVGGNYILTGRAWAN